MTTNDRNRILQADEMRPVFWDTDHWRDAARRIVKDAASQWRRVEPRARALRKEHVTALRVAFRLSPRLQAHLVASTKGRSRAALARSLSRLTMMGRVHGRLLAREGLDLRKVDDAAALSATLGSLLTALQGDEPDRG